MSDSRVVKKREEEIMDAKHSMKTRNNDDEDETEGKILEKKGEDRRDYCTSE